MNLPTIIAGPIVRRVEPTSVYIWLALSKQYQIQAKIFQQQNHADMLLSDSSSTDCIPIGKNLYIYLIKVVPVDHHKFPANKLLGYNLYFTDNANRTLDLKDFKLLQNEQINSIVYEPYNYPTFFINKEKNSTLLYGSCRKIHGDGKDALAIGDEIIKKNSSDLNNRPSSLFLLGDQIYADDVPNLLAPYLYRLGKRLIGYDEKLSDLDEEILNYRGTREKIVKERCHFTSNHSENHLLRLGEFCAMYVVSWNPELINIAVREMMDHNQIGSNEFNIIQQFSRTVPKIRRLLANIPTYMIFDDHDLTDDWNISLKWKKRVERSPLGSHVIANGLTAYWAFQGWGNNPDSFSHSFKETIKNYTSTYSICSESYKEWKELILTFDQWHYIAPTIPLTIVLDTRTQRSYSAHNKIGSIYGNQGPVLMKQSAWKHVSASLLNHGWKANSPLVIVSATPVYGVHMVEAILSNYLLPLSKVIPSVRTAFDLEWWQFSHHGMAQLYQQIKTWNPSSCIFLVGDAHMSYSLETSFYSKKNNKRKPILQFTSSPLHNETFTGGLGLALKALLASYSKLKILRNDDECNSNSERNNLHYHQLQNGSFIETKNNLGMLTFTKSDIEHFYIDSTGKKQHSLYFSLD